MPAFLLWLLLYLPALDAQGASTCPLQAACVKFFTEPAEPTTTGCGTRLWNVCADISNCAPFSHTCIKPTAFDYTTCSVVPDFKTSTVVSKNIPNIQCQLAASGTNVYFLLKNAADVTVDIASKNVSSSAPYAIPLAGSCQNRISWDEDTDNTCTTTQTNGMEYMERIWTVQAPGTATPSTTTSSATGDCSTTTITGLTNSMVLSPGSWVSWGYWFKYSGAHAATTVTVTGSVSLDVTCPKGSGTTTSTVTYTLPSKSFWVPKDSTSPVPSSGINDIRTWVYALAMKECSNNPMTITTAPVFTLTASQAPKTSMPLTFQVHWQAPSDVDPKVNINCKDATNPLRANATYCGGAWSASATAPAMTSCPVTLTTTTYTYNPPASCTMGNWGAWSSCGVTCGGGTITRSRTITTPAALGGSCGPTTESAPCATSACPISCQVGDWSTSWSTCTKTCGGGTQTRSRPIIQSALNGGTACPVTEQSQSCNTQACPVNCVMTAWSNWGTCTATCGGGTATRQRSITTLAANGGTACGATSESMQCSTQGCPVNCVMTAWSPWTTCSATCGGGTSSHTRSITTPAANGGTACGLTYEALTCNTQPCPIHCEVGVWSSTWTTCSATCGGGTRSHTRPITVQPQFGGNACPITVEAASCNTSPCPINCQVGDWSTTWSTCTKTCGGGTQLQSRPIIQSAQNGGTICPETERSQSCNTGACPVNCVMTTWSSWTTCSKTCGGGSSSHTRSITTQAANGGTACGVTSESVSCNAQACPVDCVMSGWSAFDPCSAPCGGGSATRTRSITTWPANGGATCGATSDTQACNSQACPINCQLDAWTAWTSCSASCGPGSSTRTRLVKISPSFDGQQCDFTQETLACNLGECFTAQGGGDTEIAVAAVDCVMSEWAPWQTCPVTCGGAQITRTRTITTEATSTGRQCEATVEAMSCGTILCPVNCVLGEWAAWTDCPVTCGGGQISRKRDVTTHPANGGAQCDATIQTLSCNTEGCPVDCVMNDWSEWTSCPVTCGGGQIQRERTVALPALNGGKQCEATVQTQSCNTAGCPKDCIMSQWTAWPKCPVTCGGATIDRTRTIIEPAANGGLECGITVESTRCNIAGCPVDCAMTEWDAWSTCPVTCGGGQTYRYRSITTTPLNGGAQCGDTMEATSCSTGGCPQDCVMSAWSSYPACPVTCGGAQISRTRSIERPALNGGKACEDTLESISCGTAGCPEDCTLTSWTEWGVCSLSCGTGYQLRTRDIIAPAKNGGGCGDTQEAQYCSTNPCPKDCVMSDFTRWPDCPVTCGGAMIERTRYIIYPATNGGAECGPLVESVQCNANACPPPPPPPEMVIESVPDTVVDDYCTALDTQWAKWVIFQSTGGVCGIDVALPLLAEWGCARMGNCDLVTCDADVPAWKLEELRVNYGC